MWRSADTADLAWMRRLVRARAIARSGTVALDLRPTDPVAGVAVRAAVAQRLVLDLARTYRLLGIDIASFLGLGIRDVRRRANEGLTALFVSRPVEPQRPPEQLGDT
jgi:hypothetical protein